MLVEDSRWEEERGRVREELVGKKIKNNSNIKIENELRRSV